MTVKYLVVLCSKGIIDWNTLGLSVPTRCVK